MQYIRAALSVAPSVIAGEYVPQEWRVLFLSEEEMRLNTRASMIEQAQAWVGRNEADGSFKSIIDTYNSHTPLARGYELKYTDEWCAGFVSAVAIATGNTDNVPLEVSCPRMIQIAQNMGIWQENDGYVPSPADIILYDWDDSGNGDNTANPDHVGIVESVSNGVITVIEGNMSEKVGRRSLDVDGRYIRGFITPEYKAGEDNEPQESGGKDEDTMSMKFIDISNWQAGLNVASVVKNGGLGAVIVKATEGVGFVDKSCDGFVQQCISNGIRFGFYHFARNNDAAAEAEFFRKNTTGYEGKGIPVLDWEDGQSIAWVNKFVERYHELTGVWPWVYGNAWRFNQGTVNTNCGRWVAGYPSNGITDINYGLNNDCAYKVNNGLVCAWQFSSSVRISGYSGNLDGDVFYGDAAAWDKYAGGSPASGGSGGSTTTPSGSVLSLAVGVMQGKYGNGTARKQALGSRYDEVQDFINHISTASAQTLAQEVLAGKYGNGDTRKTVLGSRYNEVQAIVNQGGKKSIDEVAREVIRGEWGNGTARKQKLEAAGYDYETVQARVNALL
jgi:GH25 family lysozyme M1 (1,4-beta-N-acetylmuramidase)